MTNEPKVPEGWSVEPLAKCVEVLDSKRKPVNSKERESRIGSVPYYGATGQVGWIDDYLFDEELVLVGEDGAPFLDKSKPIAYIIDGKSWVNNHAHVLRARRGVTSNRYIKHYLDLFDFTDYVQGSTRDKLTQGAMNTIPIVLAPYPLQDVIVRLIDTVVEKRISSAIRLATARRAIERFRQAVLAAACSGRLTADWPTAHDNVDSASVALERRRDERRKELGRRYKEPHLADPTELPEIPDSWAWASLPELGELGRGKSKHRPRNDPRLYGGQYPFIQTGDVARSGGKVTTHSQTYNEAGLAQSRIWPARTVCITIAANIADSGLLSYPACFPDSVVGLIADEVVALPEYLELFIRTARRDLAAFAPATAQANINLAILSELAVALPPIEEQREIVRRISKMFQLSDDLLGRIQSGVRCVGRSSHAVLAKAFRGEIGGATSKPR